MSANGLAFSEGLEGTTLTDQNGVLALLTAKIAPIQPLRWNAMLGATPLSHYRFRVPGNSMRSCASDHTGTFAGARVPQSIHPSNRDHGRRAPNGLAFSCRERAGNSLQKPTDLAREAVGWNPVLGGTCGVSLIGK